MTELIHKRNEVQQKINEYIEWAARHEGMAIEDYKRAYMLPREFKKLADFVKSCNNVLAFLNNKEMPHCLLDMSDVTGIINNLFNDSEY